MHSLDRKALSRTKAGCTLLMRIDDYDSHTSTVHAFIRSTPQRGKSLLARKMCLGFRGAVSSISNNPGKRRTIGCFSTCTGLTKLLYGPWTKHVARAYSTDHPSITIRCVVKRTIMRSRFPRANRSNISLRRLSDLGIAVIAIYRSNVSFAIHYPK